MKAIASIIGLITMFDTFSHNQHSVVKRISLNRHYCDRMAVRFFGVWGVAHRFLKMIC